MGFFVSLLGGSLFIGLGMWVFAFATAVFQEDVKACAKQDGSTNNRVFWVIFLSFWLGGIVFSIGLYTIINLALS